MKNEFARNIADFLRDYWKILSIVCGIGSASLIVAKITQQDLDLKQVSLTPKTLDSLVSPNYPIDFLEKKAWPPKPFEPETLGLEFFIFRKAPEYKNLDAITKDYPKAKAYIALVQKAIEENKEIFPLDAVLVLGKIWAESRFERFAVSPVGAAGPSQLMPGTAQGYGLRVYYPEYLKKAEIKNREAILLYKKAISLFTSKNFELAKETYLNYEKAKREADSLFRFYKKDLLSKVMNKPDSIIAKIDERFIIEKAVPVGVNYYALMFKKFKGDARMAISAYNCGPGPVLSASGIPYIQETVLYQNDIFNFWKKYSKLCAREQKNPTEQKKEQYFMFLR